MGHRGPLAAPIAVEGAAFLSTKFANTTWPDIQITFTSTHPGFDGGTTYKDFLGISEKVIKYRFNYAYKKHKKYCQMMFIRVVQHNVCVFCSVLSILVKSYCTVSRYM